MQFSTIAIYLPITEHLSLLQALSQKFDNIEFLKTELLLFFHLDDKLFVSFYIIDTDLVYFCKFPFR